MTEKEFVILSLELHLFFCRIMKEHSFFLAAGFTPKNFDFARKANHFKKQFGDLLLQVVKLSDGIIRSKVLESGEIVTNFTLISEENTEKLSGININTEITKLELDLKANQNNRFDLKIMYDIEDLNEEILDLVEKLIHFKKNVLEQKRLCKMFTYHYPLLIEHVLREAKMYREQLLALVEGRDFNHRLRETELFWDPIMMEHALFIRGLLDPTEKRLIKQAQSFANDFEELIEKTKAADDQTLHLITEKTLKEVSALRDFKQAGTSGLNECKIKSIIIPLLADHTLREANYFIRVLRDLES